MPLRIFKFGDLVLRPLAAAVVLALPGICPAEDDGTILRAAQGTTHVVISCADAFTLPNCAAIDDGTLRRAYFCAQNNDVIDLTQLQCSTITLGGPLTGGPPNITLNGPGKNKLTLDAASRSRAIVHTGGSIDSTLTINNLTIANGLYADPYLSGLSGGGGCIYSAMSVSLNSSTITTCSTSSMGSIIATGGAIYAKGDVTVTNSTLSYNAASGPDGVVSVAASGGAIYSRGYTRVVGSTINGNFVQGPNGTLSIGAAVTSRTFASESSTIYDNSGGNTGAIYCMQTCRIVNSTISGNSTRGTGDAIHAADAYFYNSTIAFNRINSGSGIKATHYLSLASTIVAYNASDATRSDIGLPTVATIGGSRNIIMSHAPGVIVPSDTISAPPRLGPLQANGGPTQTHALLPGSPGIDRGFNALQLPFDQRGIHFVRAFGKAPDIGAFEQHEQIFRDGFE